MRNGFTVLAALLTTSLLATPLVIGASNALATSDTAETVTQSITVTPVDVAPVAASAMTEPCAKKVRVVYSGYAAPAGCTLAAR